MIDALARPTATLRSKLLWRIPASQVLAGFAEASPQNNLFPNRFQGIVNLSAAYSAER